MPDCHLVWAFVAFPVRKINCMFPFTKSRNQNNNFVKGVYISVSNTADQI